MNYPWFAVAPGLVDNQTPLKNKIKTFICPSAPGGADRTVTGTFTFGTAFPYAGLAVTDYATCSSINTNSITFFGYPSGTNQAATYSSMRPSIKGAGTMTYLGVPNQSEASMTSITDGTSNTIM